MKICIITLGCKVNQCESDSMAKQLKDCGHNVVQQLEVADLYVLNTCAVTSIAEKKSRTHLAKFKKLNPNAKVVVCGCASQHNAEQFLSHSNVVAVFGNVGKSKIAAVLNKVGNLCEPLPLEFENFVLGETSKTRAFLKIQDGCNNFCSYCLIPYVRGRSRSRSIESIVAEAEQLAATNFEIVLTGINISDFRASGKPALAELLKSLSDLKCNIRLGSLEVNIIDQQLLSVLKNMPNFCPQFHLSMQSGCDRILKLMNRHYTSAEFLQKVELIRRNFDNATITTDVIVGFPTETDEDFEQTVQTIKKADFYEMHIFPYSKRDGTVASTFKMCDGNVVNDRAKILEQLNQQNRERFITQNSKKQFDVLTENFEGDFMVGHTKNFVKIYLPKDTPRHKFVRVTNLEPYLDGAKAQII